MGHAEKNLKKGTYAMNEEKIFINPGKKPGGALPPKTIKRMVIVGAIIIAALILISTAWYTVDEKQQAVVTTFGRVTSTTGAGMHFKLPFGIQQVNKVNVNVYQKIEIGYRTSDEYTS